MEGRINEADIVKLEEEIDQAIEAEDFQKLNELLDAREKLLPTLSVEMLKDIQKRDQQRKEALELKMKEFKESAEQMES
ncbi:MAG TPA: flagellar protein FliT, partial [Fervidobacterium sp.]|nr:flagellar protein FliT [Fervidobacterium sp.]